MTMATEAAPSSLLPSLPSISMFTSLFSASKAQDSSVQSNQPSSSPSAAAADPESTTPKVQRPSPLKTSLRQDSSLQRPSSPTKSVMFGQVEDNALNIELPSRQGSFVSNDASTDGKTKRRSSKPKTSYMLCHPPPKRSSKHKVHIRSKPLLQLHRMEAQGRPKPEYEVLPSARFSPRLAKTIVKVFGTRHGLCKTDLAIVRAERYRQEEADTEGDETLLVLALICGGRKGDSTLAGGAKIIFADGSEWDARQLANGGYECSNTDEHGLKKTVRWVQKKNKETSEVAPGESKRFNFSTISSSSRRHPVIANLSSSTLDISDSYNMPAPNMSQRNSTASAPTLERASSDNFLDASEPIVTTEDLRNIITATAVWLAVREGWCPTFRYDGSPMRLSSTRTISPSKAHTSPPGSPQLRRVSTDLDGLQRSSSTSLRQTIRTASILRRQIVDDRPQSSQSAPSIPAPTTAEASVAPVGRRARADTTSTVIVHRSSFVNRSRADTLTSSPEDADENDEDDDVEEGEDEEGQNLPEAVGKAQPAGTQTPASVSGSATSTSVAVPTATRRAASRSSYRPGSPKYDSSSTECSDIGHQKELAKLQSKQKKRKGIKALFCGMF